MRLAVRGSRRGMALVTTGVLLTGTAVQIAAPTAAHAQCEEQSGQGAIPGTANVVGLRSNVFSAWLTGPGTISRSVSTTDSSSYTLSGSYSFSISDLISSASYTFGVSLSRSVEKSSTWSYSLNVPRGETARVMVWKKALHFEVGTYAFDGSCHMTWSHKEWMNAPYRSSGNGSYLYKLDVSPGHKTTSW